MELIKWEKIASEIELSKDWDEIISLSDKVAAFQAWAKQTRQSLDTQNKIAEYRLRLERKKGKWLQVNELGQGKRTDLVEAFDQVTKPTLYDLHINKYESSIAQQIASIPDAVFEQELTDKKETGELTTAGMLRLVKGNVHVSNNSGENEWYTPQHIINKAQKFFGKIDLDPASSKLANETVKANKYFTESDNGLNQKWFGNVWLNPPYSQPQISKFSQAVVEKRNEYNQLLLLVNNATETAWLQNVLSICNSVCLIKSRIKFIDKDGQANGAPLQGQVIVYIGGNVKEFYNNFQDLGICLKHI